MNTTPTTSLDRATKATPAYQTIRVQHSAVLGERRFNIFQGTFEECYESARLNAVGMARHFGHMHYSEMIEESISTEAWMGKGFRVMHGLWFGSVKRSASEHKEVERFEIEPLPIATTDHNEARPSTLEQDASDARFYLALESQPEGESEECDFYDPSDRF